MLRAELLLDLADIQLNLGESAKSQALLESVAAEREHLHGSASIEHAEAEASLAAALAATGKFEPALERIGRATATLHARLGLDHPSTLAAQSRRLRIWLPT